MPRRPRGFTLMEVLVALAVLAIALTAVMRTLAQAIDATATLRERHVALWLAQNRLAEHQMRRDWPAADTRDGDIEFNGQKWFWREQVSTTPDAAIRRIEITIRRQSGSEDTQARLVGYLRNNAAGSGGALPAGTQPPGA
jgi:general secretion pathway protein I